MSVHIMSKIDSDFMQLFEIFTSAPDSIGRQLHRELGAHHSDDPLMVVTGSEIFLFPGAGKPVTANDYRLTQRGFYEMTGVSHLRLAIPYLARPREFGFAGWERAARDILVPCSVVRKTTSTSFRRDTGAGAAGAGLEVKDGTSVL